MQDGLTVRERTHGRFSVVLVSPGGSLEESRRAREKGEWPEAPSIVGHRSSRYKRAWDGDAFVNANYERCKALARDDSEQGYIVRTGGILRARGEARRKRIPCPRPDTRNM